MPCSCRVLGQILGHALGEHGHQRAIAGPGGGADFAEHVVDLALGGTHLDRWIDQPGRADHLLCKDAAGLLHLPFAGRCRDRDRERPHGVPFLEAQRPVVHAGGQAKAILG